ncbi:MAG TPA: ribosomal-protein-alanine N-acetyltransferase [Desulfobacterales bacterium]|nr:ribosomal-protein-alanine N-acetyltransferase [Desulfobacterales bacterium]
MCVRQMLVGDVGGVAAIEAGIFSSWNRAQIVSELKRKTGLSLVAVAPNRKVLAWCCGFQTGVDAELLKITVSPSNQRLGIAKALLQELYAAFTKQGAEQIFLEVRSQNDPALCLYAKYGFRETGRRKSYYKDPVDDAVLLVCRLNNNDKDQKGRVHEYDS